VQKKIKNEIHTKCCHKYWCFN